MTAIVIVASRIKLAGGYETNKQVDSRSTAAKTKTNSNSDIEDSHEGLVYRLPI